MKIGDGPMMSEKDIAAIELLLQNYPLPLTCLEFGAGQSTVHFSRHYKVTSWLAIEHNGHYVKFLQGKLPEKATVAWLPEDNYYYDFIKHSDPKYDFVLIDGLHRPECVEIAHYITRSNAIILLHDYARPEYQEVIRQYKTEVISPPTDINGRETHQGLLRFIKEPV